MQEIAIETFVKNVVGNVCFIVQVGILAHERKQDRVNKFNC